MSQLAAKGIATIGAGKDARDFVVYELTPVELRQVLMNNPWPGAEATPEQVSRYQIDVMLLKDISLTDLAVFVRLPVTELESIPPKELRKILDKAKELNPDFFEALARMAERQSNA